MTLPFSALRRFGRSSPVAGGCVAAGRFPSAGCAYARQLWRPERGRPRAGASEQDAEHRIIRRAQVRVSLLVGLAVGALLALGGGISYAALVHSQQEQIARELDYGATYGVTSGPPACSWIFLYDGTTTDSGTNPPPPGFPLQSALDEVAAKGIARNDRIDRNGTTYYLRTQPRGATVVQALFDARFQLSDRHHLLAAFLLAAAVGLVAAVLTGIAVGRRAVAPLVEALGRQRRFVADASHELRTPIAQVHTRAQLLARRARAGLHPGEHDYDRLLETTRRLGEIVDELLLSARLAAAPAGPPTTAPIDLARLAAQAVTAETDRATERGIRVDLIRPAAPLPVTGIESALRRVVGELLANALTHTPRGGRIEVAVRELPRARAELTVTDTGAGFDPADTDRLFDRFHRGAGPGAGPGSGSGGRRFGLGLALLREVVTSHGGTITAEGHPGAGASFTVRLPTTTATTAPPTATPVAA